MLNILPTNKRVPVLVNLQGSDGKHGGVNGKPKKDCSNKRTYVVDEDMLSDILVEMASLRSTVIELQHHLIGVSYQYYD